MCDHPVPPVTDRYLRLRIGQVAGHQPVPHQTLRAGHRQRREEGCALPGAHHTADPRRTIQTTRERLGRQVTAAHQRVADRDQLVRWQPLGEVEPGLRSGRRPQTVVHDDVLLGEPAGVDDELGALREHSTRGHGDVGAERHVDVRPEERSRGAVTVGRVRREEAGQQRQTFSSVDGIVQRDDEVVGRSDEPRSSRLRSGRSRGAGGGGGVGARQDHAPDVAVAAPSAAVPAQGCGAGRGLWTAVAHR